MFMSVPKGIVKIKNKNVEFTSNVDYTCYTLKELIRAALRDSGRLFAKRFKQKYYSTFHRKTGRVGRYTQYWVRTRQETPDLLVGIKPGAFYGAFEEFGATNRDGSQKIPAYGLFLQTAEESIPEITQIMSHYLTSLQNDNFNVGMIQEEGSADDG